MAGERKLRVSCGPVATFNPSKQEAKGGSNEAQDSIVLSMSNELLYLVPELHTHTAFSSSHRDRHNDGKGKQGVRQHDDGDGRRDDGKGQQGDRRHDDGDGSDGWHDDGKGQQGNRRYDDGDGKHDDVDGRNGGVNGNGDGDNEEGDGDDEDGDGDDNGNGNGNSDSCDNDNDDCGGPLCRSRRWLVVAFLLSAARYCCRSSHAVVGTCIVVRNPLS